MSGTGIDEKSSTDPTAVAAQDSAAAEPQTAAVVEEQDPSKKECWRQQEIHTIPKNRGVQGVGGGGIIQLMLITIGDIVVLEERAKYAGMMG
ncbi:hypothetical protein HHX47_DHR1000156 [Lentinula edodes]|nr:hypothetical protein HHX47_DHR1000156 [Lentinula edodes]